MTKTDGVDVPLAPSSDASWVKRLRDTAKHLRENSLSLAKYPGMADESRARELAALYIQEIAELFEAKRALGVKGTELPGAAYGTQALGPGHFDAEPAKCRNCGGTWSQHDSKGRCPRGVNPSQAPDQSEFLAWARSTHKLVPVGVRPACCDHGKTEDCCAGGCAHDEELERANKSWKDAAAGVTAARKPMTEAEIYCAWDSSGCPLPLEGFSAIVRCTEAHHGITAGVAPTGGGDAKT